MYIRHLGHSMIGKNKTFCLFYLYYRVEENVEKLRRLSLGGSKIIVFIYLPYLRKSNAPSNLMRTPILKM